jgi:hypothetical protein
MSATQSSSEVLPAPALSSPASRVIRLSAVMVGSGLLLVSKIPLCPIALLTGHPCPGCGLTRASFAALHGDFVHAHALHPLVWLAAPLVGISALVAAHSYFTIGRVRFGARANRYLIPPLTIAYVLLIGVWLIRFTGALGGPVPVDPGLLQAIRR